MKNDASHDGRGHAPLPPSASSRWLKCAPSQGYIKRLLDKKVITPRVSGPAAERGTRIHEEGERIIALMLKGKTVTKPKKVAQDEHDEAFDYARYVLTKRDDLALLYHGEQELGVEDRAIFVEDLCWGSRDVWILTGQHLCVIDLKTGREPVYPEGNPQEIIYAVDIVERCNPKTIELCIWQPNASDGRPPERSFTYSREAFEAEAAKIRSGVDVAAKWLDKKRGHEKDLVAGDHCRWCDALGVCPSARDRNLATSQKEFLPVAVDKMSAPPAPDVLSPEQVAEIMRRAPEFKAWLDAIEVRALELASKGSVPPGFKVVERITHRAFKPEYTDAQIARGIGLKTPDIQKTVRLPITQIEKMLPAKGKEKLQKFIFKPPGLPVIVADSDRRVPMLATHINFTPVSDEEIDNG